MPSPVPERWREFVPVAGCRGKVRKLSFSSACGILPCTGVTVTAHYVCYLGTSMKQIDSSRDRGCPLKVQLGRGGVVRGLEAALAAMVAGERSRVWMAGSYGYGKKGVKGEVPPNCPLVMDVELIGWEVT
jgi:FKBP-type peptidyl-prolyl cis-trans isomerase